MEGVRSAAVVVLKPGACRHWCGGQRGEQQQIGSDQDVMMILLIIKINKILDLY